jgi:hypothetical protein
MKQLAKRLVVLAKTCIRTKHAVMIFLMASLLYARQVLAVQKVSEALTALHGSVRRPPQEHHRVPKSASQKLRITNYHRPQGNTVRSFPGSEHMKETSHRLSGIEQYSSSHWSRRPKHLHDPIETSKSYRNVDDIVWYTPTPLNSAGFRSLVSNDFRGMKIERGCVVAAWESRERLIDVCVCASGWSPRARICCVWGSRRRFLSSSASTPGSNPRGHSVID